MKAKFKCARCAECCKRYWITILPEEARAIAELLGISVKKFLENHCMLFLQAFPASPDFSNPLVKGISKCPSGLRKKLEKKTSADYFLCLPGIALKRDGLECSMLSKGFECKIHSRRPGQCRLFPLISMNSNADLKKAYSFCKGLEGFEKPLSAESKRHYRKVKAYFEKLKLKKFKALWPAIPSGGILVLDREKVCNITAKQFFQAVGF